MIKTKNKVLIFIFTVVLCFLTIAFASWQFSIRNVDATVETLIYNLELYDIDNSGELIDTPIITYTDLDIGTGIELPRFEHEGKVFNGFQLHKENDSVSYYNGDTYISSLIAAVEESGDIDIQDKTIKLYAKYGIATVNVFLYVDDTQNPMDTYLNSFGVEYGKNLRDVSDTMFPTTEIYINQREFNLSENEKATYLRRWELNGWYKDVLFQNNKDDSDYYLTSDIVLYAKIDVRKYDVEWHNHSTNNIFNDSTLIKKDTNVPYGRTINFGAGIPERNADGRYTYEFNNTKWREFTVDNGIATISPTEKSNVLVTSDKSLVAGYDRTAISYSISINENGGTFPNNYVKPNSYTCEDTITIPDPTRIGYTFRGWSGTGLSGDHNKSLSFTDNIGNKTFTANWDPITYTIKCNYLGGSFNNLSSKTYTFTIEDSAFTLQSPSKNGYTFDGWANKGGSTIVHPVNYSVNPSLFITSNEVTSFEYDAKYTIKTYTISLYYLYDDDSPYQTKNYNVESNDIVLSDPTPRTGYDFAGFYYDSSFNEPVTNSTIPSGSYGDKNIYCKWDAKPLTVELYVDGDKTDIYNNLHYDDEITILPEKIKTGYDFAYWEDENHTIYRNSTQQNPAYWKVFGTFKLYAVFTPRVTTVTLYGNGGKFTDGLNYPTSKNVSVTYDAAWNFEIPTCKGYDFDGYVVHNTSTPFARNGSAWNIDQSTYALDATWQVRTYKLKFVKSIDPNSLDIEYEYEYVTFNTNYDISDHTLSIPGHTFVGWTPDLTTEEDFDPSSVLANSGKWSYDNFQEENDEKVITLYPYVTANEYDVLLNYNDGQDHSSDNLVSITYAKVPASIPSSPTKTGYEFDGWYFNTNIPQTKIDLSKEWVYYPEDANLSSFYQDDHWILNAKWNAKQYTVNIDLDGGLISGDTLTQTTLTYDSALNIGTPVKTGYTFQYWACSVNSTHYLNTSTWNVDQENVTLTAIYTANAYTVNVDLDGGKINNSDLTSTSLTYGSAINIGTPVKTGYTFQYWACSANSTQYSNGDTWNVAQDGVTLTAIYTANQYNVNIDLAGGLIGGNTLTQKTLTYGSALNIGTPIKTGYTFQYWACSANSTHYSDSDTWNVAQDGVTLTAIYSGDSYNVTLDLAGGSGVSTSQTVTYGQALKFGTPTKTGYTFAGWKGQDNVIYQNDAVWSTVIAGAYTFTAQYTANATSVTLDAGSGSLTGSSNVTIDYDEIVNFEVPTYDGYTFNYWYDKDNTSNHYVNGDTWNVDASSISLAAYYTAISYTITYDLDGGTLGENTNPSTYTIESSNITLNNPTKDGYTFVGWVLLDSNDQEVGEPTETYVITQGSTGNLKLKAVFELNS